LAHIPQFSGLFIGYYCLYHQAFLNCELNNMPYNPSDWSDEHYAKITEDFIREKVGTEDITDENKKIKSELYKDEKQKPIVLKKPTTNGRL
jgi:hypothetical protein